MIDSKNKKVNVLIDENNKNKINTKCKKHSKELAMNFSPQNRFIRYFKERQIFYESINYPTPILDRIIKENIKIDYNLFSINTPKDNWIVEPFYPNMRKLINAFNDKVEFDEEIIAQKNIGYACYEKNNKYFEGIFSTLDNSIIFNEISNKDKFKRDNIYHPNVELADNCFKARGLSLEYYINNLMSEQLKLTEIPRIIYPFKPEFTINEKFNPIEELDGVFYSFDEKILNIEGLPFIIDNKLSFNDQELIFEQNSNVKNITFYKNSLILFEIKNRFPGTNVDSDVEVELEEELFNLFSKVSIFYQINMEKYEELEKVQIVLFYDTIAKEGYEDILKQAFHNYFKDKSKLSSKVEFLCIFIITSYFAYNTKNLMDKIKYLELKTIENEKKGETFDKESNNLKEIIAKLKSEDRIKCKRIKNLEDSNYNHQSDKKSMEKKIMNLEKEKKGMEEKIMYLEKEKKGMEEKIMNLEKEKKGMEEKVMNLEKEKKYMKKKIDNLEKKVQLLEISNAKLHETVETNTNKMEEFIQIMDNYKNYIYELKYQNNELNNTIEIKEKEIQNMRNKLENKK